MSSAVAVDYGLMRARIDLSGLFQKLSFGGGNGGEKNETAFLSHDYYTPVMAMADQACVLGPVVARFIPVGLF